LNAQEVLVAHDVHAENDHARERLRSLGASLRPEDWQKRLPNGWTVTTAYLHLAYWDRLALELLERHERTGVEPVRHEVSLLNAVLVDLSGMLTAAQAFAWAVRCADAVDAKIRALPASLLQEITEKDSPRRIERHHHRNEHLDEVLRTLGRT
jgi:hypothetical protein